ncbi:hypothetical protein GGS23DRAFT_599418 [Durotheca rogersii]|uniref:uncharacterized protein n=1 Tax=Durotheca rogersii TaxID=419775 RepID=UPI002220981B|nr:uncharacterized protein GGS23DRAFT_599418 [Durotheca rogersii]KAI5860610.1 hypothetical protein GGS23DRAFT_599418 [Durotheca rogersii]
MGPSPAALEPARRSILDRPILIAIPILIGLFATRSPFFMSAAPAFDPAAPEAAAVPWADAPIPLVTTPQYETNKTDIFTTGATHMALLHNVILRGYNSIWQQAPHVRPADVPDFVGYCRVWHQFVVHHHDDEEGALFPKIAALLLEDDENVDVDDAAAAAAAKDSDKDKDKIAANDEAIWGATHREHAAFLGGLAAFSAYLDEVASGARPFSGAGLRGVMSGFEEAFAAHFHSEVRTIAGLAGHARAPRAGSAREAAAAATFRDWGRATVMRAGALDGVPFFLLNLDATAEGGRWARWPPMPPPVRWGLENIAGAWHARRWRFASCLAGRPRRLYALGPESA